MFQSGIFAAGGGSRKQEAGSIIKYLEVIILFRND
jgi:hypothetical protein